MDGIPFWVSEGSIRKYHRAVETLRKDGKEITEDAVRELFIKYGGLVLSEAVAEEVAVEKKARKSKA